MRHGLRGQAVIPRARLPREVIDAAQHLPWRAHRGAVHEAPPLRERRHRRGYSSSAAAAEVAQHLHRAMVDKVRLRVARRRRHALKHDVAHALVGLLGWFVWCWRCVGCVVVLLLMLMGLWTRGWLRGCAAAAAPRDASRERRALATRRRSPYADSSADSTSPVGPAPTIATGTSWTNAPPPLLLLLLAALAKAVSAGDSPRVASDSSTDLTSTGNISCYTATLHLVPTLKIVHLNLLQQSTALYRSNHEPGLHPNNEQAHNEAAHTQTVQHQESSSVARISRPSAARRPVDRCREQPRAI